MNSFDRQIVDITRSVWSSMLGLDVSPMPELPPSDGGPEIRATVEIRGSWSGQLTLACPQNLARRAAAVFFDRAPGSVVESESLDAVGELANMTCGNLKALLPGSCDLSTPRTVLGRDPGPAPGALRLGFACWPQFFTVELTKEDPA